MVSDFIKAINYHQAEIRRLSEVEDMAVSYDVLRSAGLIKPYTIRLPVHVIAQLDYLVEFGPWPTKAEMVYSIFSSAISEFLNDAEVSDQVRQKFQEIAQQALDQRQSGVDQE